MPDRPRASLTKTYFDDLYRRSQDPWRFETSPYERDKYAATLAALPRERYARGLEAGCSIGILTRQLAMRCDRLLSFDASALPLERAREICADVSNVAFRQVVLPQEWPEGNYDLIVLSEILYYFNATDLSTIAARVRSSLMASGHVVCVHWIRETDYPLTGDQAAELFIADLRDVMHPVAQMRNENYRIDVLEQRLPD
jgi:2-polyprenyl-3-methyl-5-hydroxy-6-metoxy-1,4-benzoquinol methylase